MKVKLILIILYSLLTLTFNFAQTSIDSNSSDESKIATDKGNFKKLSYYDSTLIFFWTSYGSTAFTSFINVFAQLGYANTVSTELASLCNELKKINVGNISFIYNFSQNYQLINFGYHFLHSGTAYIPIVGGIIYGSLLYGTGILFSIMRIFDPLNIFFFGSTLSSDIFNYTDRLSLLYNKIFDPVPCFIVGTFSIILGIAEIVSYVLYNKEMKRKKYPYMQKIFSLTPEGIVVKIHV